MKRLSLKNFLILFRFWSEREWWGVVSHTGSPAFGVQTGNNSIFVHVFNSSILCFIFITESWAKLFCNFRIPDLDPDPGILVFLFKKISYFSVLKTAVYRTSSPFWTSRLKEKPPSLLRENPALHNMKSDFLPPRYCESFLIFAFLDTDSEWNSIKITCNAEISHIPRSEEWTANVTNAFNCF